MAAQTLSPVQTPTSSLKMSLDQKNIRRPSRAQCLLSPRAYDEIYHERAYLATYSQKITQRIQGLIKEYSETEAQLNLGAKGQPRRRLRKLMNMLKCKLDAASEQERAIFNRMGELYMELNSRDTWERARAVQVPAGSVGPTVADDDEQIDPPGTPCPSFASSDWSADSSSLSAESPIFTPASPVVSAVVQEYHGELPLGRYLTSEYLETVPEDFEGVVEKKDLPMGPLGQEDNKNNSNNENTAAQPVVANVPEMGSLEYQFVQQCDLNDDVFDEEDECGSESGCDTAPKRTRRWSLPSMQFTWPDQ